MGATSEVELRITPDTVIEVTNDNVDPTDSSLYVIEVHLVAPPYLPARACDLRRPLLDFVDLNSGTLPVGTLGRVRAYVEEASPIFQPGVFRVWCTCVFSGQTTELQGRMRNSKTHKITLCV